MLGCLLTLAYGSRSLGTSLGLNMGGTTLLFNTVLASLGVDMITEEVGKEVSKLESEIGFLGWDMTYALGVDEVNLIL